MPNIKSNKASLINAATILIQKFETPEILLELLSEGLGWVCEENSRRGISNNIFVIKLLIDEVYKPWVKCSGNEIETIARGLRWFSESCSYEEYHSCVNSIMKGFKRSFSYGNYFSTYSEQCLQGINVLIEIGSGFAIHSQSKLSKVA